MQNRSFSKKSVTSCELCMCNYLFEFISFILFFVCLTMMAGSNKWINVQRGYTALMCAARNGRTDNLRLLLEGGADMEAQDNVREICAALIFSCRECACVHAWSIRKIGARVISNINYNNCEVFVSKSVLCVVLFLDITCLIRLSSCRLAQPLYRPL